MKYLLRAMASNYPVGHMIDHLDIDVFMKSADLIEEQEDKIKSLEDIVEDREDEIVVESSYVDYWHKRTIELKEELDQLKQFPKDLSGSDIVARLITGGESEEEMKHLCTYLAPTEIRLLRGQITGLQKRLQEAIEVRKHFSEYANVQSNEAIAAQKEIIRLRKIIESRVTLETINSELGIG